MEDNSELMWLYEMNFIFMTFIAIWVQWFHCKANEMKRHHSLCTNCIWTSLYKWPIKFIVDENQKNEIYFFYIHIYYTWFMDI